MITSLFLFEGSPLKTHLTLPNIRIKSIWNMTEVIDNSCYSAEHTDGRGKEAESEK